MRGMNANDTVINSNGLLDIHMPAYYDAVNKGVATVMVSYSSLNGLKMHANKKLVTGFLKKKLKFKVTLIIRKNALLNQSIYKNVKGALNIFAGHCHIRFSRC